MILLIFLQLVAVGEVDFLQEEVGSAMIVSRVVGALAEAGVMAGVNSEVWVNFQGDQKVPVLVMERDRDMDRGWGRGRDRDRDRDE